MTSPATFHAAVNVTKQGHCHAHKMVGVEIAAMHKAMGYAVDSETQGFLPGASKPDFACALGAGKFLLLDQSMAHPLGERSSRRRGAARVDLHCAITVIERKKQKYKDHAEGNGHTHVTCAIETTGGWGPQFTTHFKQWIETVREKDKAAGRSSWHATHQSIMWQQRVSKALYESLAVRIGQRYLSRAPDERPRAASSRLAQLRRRGR